MVKNKLFTDTKELYRKAVLEVIEFSAEDIVTSSPVGGNEEILDGEFSSDSSDWF